MVMSHIWFTAAQKADASASGSDTKLSSAVASATVARR